MRGERPREVLLRPHAEIGILLPREEGLAEDIRLRMLYFKAPSAGIGGIDKLLPDARPIDAAVERDEVLILYAVVVVQMHGLYAVREIAADPLFPQEAVVVPRVEADARPVGAGPLHKCVEPVGPFEVLECESDVRALRRIEHAHEARIPGLVGLRRCSGARQMHDERRHAVIARLGYEADHLGAIALALKAVLPEGIDERELQMRVLYRKTVFGGGFDLFGYGGLEFGSRSPPEEHGTEARRTDHAQTVVELKRVAEPAGHCGCGV